MKDIEYWARVEARYDRVDKCTKCICNKFGLSCAEWRGNQEPVKGCWPRVKFDEK